MEHALPLAGTPYVEIAIIKEVFIRNLHAPLHEILFPTHAFRNERGLRQKDYGGLFRRLAHL